MKHQDAERITTEYLKPIFGFALKRCQNTEDAEDLSQEIVLKAFRALLSKDDIADVGKFIWTIAHNALSNYYRENGKSMVCVSVDEVAEVLADPGAELGADDDAEVIHRLQSEIAYLSKLQRRIVIAYYFENRKQTDIAKELDIPLGTVKWHLFEAKKELKRDMDTMRNASELKFNPIRFYSYGTTGQTGTKSLEEFFRAALPQNICYCVRRQAKTINEIADDLGVSPVYVEGEVEFLEEYGFLLKQKDKYIANFIMDESSEELLTMQNRMYAAAAKDYADDLYEALTASGLLDDQSILCHQTDGEISMTEDIPKDKNFLLWSLIPYITANAGKDLLNTKIARDEVATIRPDGGNNIFRATIYNPKLNQAADILSFNECVNGPCWNVHNGRVLWQIDTQWSERPYMIDTHYSKDAVQILSLFTHEQEDILSKDEYAWLAERGFVKTCGDYNGLYKSAWQVVILADPAIQDKLLQLGESVKAKHISRFEELKKPYSEAILQTVPSHLRKVKEYDLQFLLHNDPRFLLHCIHALLDSGKLKEPTAGQRKALSTLITYA